MPSNELPRFMECVPTPSQDEETFIVHTQHPLCIGIVIPGNEVVEIVKWYDEYTDNEEQREALADEMLTWWKEHLEELGDS